MGQPLYFQLAGNLQSPPALERRNESRLYRRCPYTPYDADKSSLVTAWNAQGKPYYDYTRYNEERLPAFTQVDIRIDKTFYLKRCMLGFYIDLQNIAGSKPETGRCINEHRSNQESGRTDSRTTVCHEVAQARKRYTAADFGNHV